MTESFEIITVALGLKQDALHFVSELFNVDFDFSNQTSSEHFVLASSSAGSIEPPDSSEFVFPDKALVYLSYLENEVDANLEQMRSLYNEFLVPASTGDPLIDMNGFSKEDIADHINKLKELQDDINYAERNVRGLSAEDRKTLLEDLSRRARELQEKSVQILGYNV